MAFIYCKCGWSQDDFWSPTYSPLRYLIEAWEKMLLEDDLDEQFTDCATHQAGCTCDGMPEGGDNNFKHGVSHR